VFCETGWQRANGWSRALQALGEEKEIRLDQDKKGSSKAKKAGLYFFIYIASVVDLWN
jgi:hypothetical protein